MTLLMSSVMERVRLVEECACSCHLLRLGVLLPLWKFFYEKEKKKQVTSLAWNPDRQDLFSVGFGSYDFTRQGPGLIACFSLKNPTYPEFLFKTESGVMCLDFHKEVCPERVCFTVITV